MPKAGKEIFLAELTILRQYPNLLKHYTFFSTDAEMQNFFNPDELDNFVQEIIFAVEDTPEFKQQEAIDPDLRNKWRYLCLAAFISNPNLSLDQKKLAVAAIPFDEKRTTYSITHLIKRL